MSKRAVTLLELMVVILIIGILSTIAMPKYKNFVERSKYVEAYVYLGVVKIAQEAYILEFKEAVEDIEDLEVPQPLDENSYFNYGIKAGVGFNDDSDKKYMLYGWRKKEMKKNSEDGDMSVHTHGAGDFVNLERDEATRQHSHREFPKHSHSIPKSEERSSEERYR